MATKKTKPAKPDENKATPEEQAKYSVRPEIAGAAAMEPFNKALFPDADIGGLMDELKTSIKAVQSGDMSGMEAMLVAQAQALQTMFVSLMRNGQSQKYLKQYQTHIHLALKAQAQSRATIQALVELKYPRQIVVTKQANIAHGHQQVNNTPVQDYQTNTRTHAHARENEIQQNELLEANHGGETLDSRATQTTIPQDKAMAAVG